MKHTVCTICGANLDFGEACDCRTEQKEEKGEKKMNETTITIAVDEYTKLVRASERIAAIERLFEATRYATAQDVAAILGIERSDPYDIQ